VSDTTPPHAPSLTVSRHPAVLHKLAILRDEKTEPKKFREVVRELSWLLGYEALADARLRPRRVRTRSEEVEAHELGDRIGLVPILRAASEWSTRCSSSCPAAEVWHLGLFRDEHTLRPVEVLQQVARFRDGRPLPHPRPDARHGRLGDGPRSRS